MIRRGFILALSCALIGGLVASASAAAPEIEDTMTGWSVLTPGQSGVPFTVHVNDQVDPYANLVEDFDITAEELPDYYHPLQFNDATGDGYQPPGNTAVTIYRSDDGVPQVYGDTDDAMAYGIGYAMAEDRMWQMDVFRHVARGTAASFVDDSWLDDDKAVRRNGYTDAEFQKMYDDFDDRFGDVGATSQSILQAYTDGVNAFVAENMDTPPGEYVATHNVMTNWDVTDSIALTVFQGRSFGGDGAQEVERAANLKTLQELHGDEVGRAIWEDLLFKNDAESYTTIPESEGTFPNPLWGEPNDKAIAIPDNVKSVARKIARNEGAQWDAAAKVGFSRLASNGIVVAGSATDTGDPIHYGAPQVGYATPSFLYEIEGHSPNFDFAGPTVPGGGPAIVLGRTAHLAWMIPVGVGDMMDERAELLCNPNGGKVKRSSKYYKFKGKCKKMKIRTETIYIKDAEDDPVKMKVRRTVHGPVVATATVKGKPVAISQERTTWMREPDLLVAFGMWTNNDTDTQAEFAEGVEVFPMSFNILYADSEETAYYYGGHHAIRADGVDRRLPSWGTGKWEWQGYMTEEQRPRMVDPEQGWFVNWNNKPSVGWDSTASSTWGAAQRAILLANGMAAHEGPFSMTDVIQVAANAATQDSYAVQLWPNMSASVIADSPAEVAALAALETWVADGAHRLDVDRNDLHDSSPAAATWDTMLSKFTDAVMLDEVGSYSNLGFGSIDDAANSNGSSYFFSLPDYMLHMVQGHDVYSRDYCDDMNTEAAETCAQQIQAAFDAAVAELSADQGDLPLTWEWPAEYIEFTSFGGTTVTPFPWQNRGTWNHVLQLHGGA